MLRSLFFHAITLPFKYAVYFFLGRLFNPYALLMNKMVLAVDNILAFWIGDGSLLNLRRGHVRVWHLLWGHSLWRHSAWRTHSGLRRHSARGAHIQRLTSPTGRRHAGGNSLAHHRYHWLLGHELRHKSRIESCERLDRLRIHSHPKVWHSRLERSSDSRHLYSLRLMSKFLFFRCGLSVYFDLFFLNQFLRDSDHAKNLQIERMPASFTVWNLVDTLFVDLKNVNHHSSR